MRSSKDIESEIRKQLLALAAKCDKIKSLMIESEIREQLPSLVARMNKIKLLMEELRQSRLPENQAQMQAQVQAQEKERLTNQLYAARGIRNE